MTVATPELSFEERQLVERIGTGDQEAFRLLFDRYHLEIYRFCALLLGERATAEDIYQETFLAFYGMCRARKEIKNVHGLLLTIARNGCLNALKASRKKLPLESALDVLERTDTLDVDAIDVGEHLQNALLQIPRQYREALLLFEVEGYNYREIGEHLDISLHVVKNRIYYAKRMLRALLEPLFSS